VVVFEASESVGGMAGSFEVGGLRVDYGSHRLHASTAPVFLQRLKALLGDDLQARERNGRIRLRDRWVGFPLRIGDMVRHLPPDFGARVGADAARGLMPSVVRARTGRSDDPVGFVDQVTSRLGPTVTAEFYHPYAAKLYGVDPHSLTAELARRRVSAASPTAILRKAFQARNLDGRTFYYPRRGYGQVSEALADAAVAAGVDLRLGHPVTAVRAGPRPTVTTAGTDATTSTADTTSTAVLSTMPLPALTAAMGPDVPDEVRQAVGSLRVRAMVLVYLVLDRRQYTPFDAHYFPSLDISMSRLSEPKNYRDGDDPDDVTVLCAEVPCWPEDKIWTASDAELGDRIVEDLARAGLPDPGPVQVEARRLRAVYPVYEHSTTQARTVVERWLADIPGVLTFGRQGLGVPDNLHHVIDMGLAAANAATASPAAASPTTASPGLDHVGWAAELRRFADNIVVD
jgi:protoporphyrinogen oxidase